ncbi:MAG: type III pantothenate kinase [Candidatus Omnitrophica bacterium]|nr:type III pantothenate kinase [Candidatus Omnitrophota bacterium]
MILVIDIGNTNIKLALFSGRRILKHFRLATDKKASAKKYKRRLSSLFARKKIKRSQIKGAIACSVVPRINNVFSNAVFSLCREKPLFLGKDIIAPIKNLYKRPSQVGQDRLANAFGAYNLYGGPVVIVDFGTALTFDLVSEKGEYLGGIIVPGPEIALKALIKNADLLPYLTLTKPVAFLGRETKESIRSGLVYGYSFLVEGILSRLKAQLKRRPKIVATGGAASLMSIYCPSIKDIAPHLTLQGLNEIYIGHK